MVGYYLPTIFLASAKWLPIGHVHEIGFVNIRGFPKSVSGTLTRR
jgi:hypothetical protein